MDESGRCELKGYLLGDNENRKTLRIVAFRWVFEVPLLSLLCSMAGIMFRTGDMLLVVFVRFVKRTNVKAYSLSVLSLEAASSHIFYRFTAASYFLVPLAVLGMFIICNFCKCSFKRSWRVNRLSPDLSQNEPFAFGQSQRWTASGKCVFRCLSKSYTRSNASRHPKWMQGYICASRVRETKALLVDRSLNCRGHRCAQLRAPRCTSSLVEKCTVVTVMLGEAENVVLILDPTAGPKYQLEIPRTRSSARRW